MIQDWGLHRSETLRFVIMALDDILQTFEWNQLSSVDKFVKTEVAGRPETSVTACRTTLYHNQGI
jgi:hypothetical protein